MKPIKNKWIKRVLRITGIGLLVVCVSALALYIWIDFSVKANIVVAKQKYAGTADDDLIAYLLDENNSANSLTHLAIYNLGQIGSKKALPVLYKLYKYDPEGKTYRCKHNTVLCQYGLYRAIDCIEKDYIFLHKGLNK